VLGPLLLAAAGALAPTSDLFEIEVYSADTVDRAEVMVEQHTNVTSEHGAHLTWEAVLGLTRWLEAAAYLATEIQSGSHDYAVSEGRIRLRPRTPDGFPVRASFNVEAAFDEGGFLSLELRPIWSGAWGRVHTDVDGAFGIDRSGDVDLEPAVKIAVDVGAGLEACLEYYGALGPISSPAPAARQWHQLYGAIDVVRFRAIEINAGAGVGLDGATDPFVAKLIVGYRFR
jgi:hypothetical protein